ncbi:MAG: TIGR02710 family CRISPR-associated CARF protein [Acetobacteraceae bacterium]|nr:TIGR02710 family CRISPR-associated CARF protein [Acetobacteraceae bacterium]
MLILVASVGGSADPIASAIAARRPDRVVFLASEPRGEKPGSVGEIPGILQKAQRPKQAHDIVRLADPDDPEAAFLALREAVGRLRADHPGARLLFDYTGGTKSMTSAVFQCALAIAGAELQFMAGRREDLRTVKPGTERPTAIPVAWLLAERQEARLRAAWKAFDYAAAAAGYRRLHEDLGGDEKAPEELRQRLADLAAISEAFELWDRFRHADAAAILAAVEPRVRGLRPFREQAEACTRQTPARILDLWRNAERCAARGRHDDAVARLYRLVEWIAQWRLHEKHGLDASRMDWNRLSQKQIAAAGLSEQTAKKTLSGSVQAWKLVATVEPEGVVSEFLSAPFSAKDRKKTGEGRLRDMLDLRNHSILAHGERPLGEAEWEKWMVFADELHRRVLSPLLQEAGVSGRLPPQLPRDPAELGL